LGWIGTTVKSASTKVSTNKPEGRSMATGGEPKRRRRRRNSVSPPASWSMSKRSTTPPRSSMTHSACVLLAQSSPAK